MAKKIYIGAGITSIFLLMAFLYQQAFSQDRIDRSSELTEHYSTMLSKHKRSDSQIKKGAIIFIGDSITEGLNVEEISDRAVNYGISMDTTYGVTQRIPIYESLSRAQIIIVSVGVNDLAYGHSNSEIIADIKTIMLQLPSNPKLILNAIFPVDESADSSWRGWNKRIIQINETLNNYAIENGIIFNSINDRLLDNNGQLADKYHQGDGVHLSSDTYRLWSDSLKKAVDNL